MTNAAAPDDKAESKKEQEFADSLRLVLSFVRFLKGKKPCAPVTSSTIPYRN
jgi:hypothetical protein